MGIDLRILFLIFLFATLVLHILRFGAVFEAVEVKNMLLDVLYVPALLGTAVVFGLLLTRTDPMPLLRDAAYQLSLQQLVSFDRAIPDRLDETIDVQSVLREDTDGDGLREWVVFYRFDLQNGTSPVKGVIYDSDRGNPPVLFPYQLQVPARDYLSDQPGSLEFRMAPVVLDENGIDNLDVEELLVSDNDTLSIFRFSQNSEPWDFPRDAPLRYQAIGYFKGSGGVSFDENTKNVTVIDREGYERSQLAVRSVYQLQSNGSYWDTFDPLLLSESLAAPIITTIDFYREPPRDIYSTAFPEKIVLAFYAASCGIIDDTLCLNGATAENWFLEDFLAADALTEFERGNAAYFGLPDFGTSNLSVTTLRYFPRLETDTDLLVTGGGRDVVTGEEGQLNLVDITFSTGGRLETVRYQMELVNGQWKIVRRLEIDSTALDAPIEVPGQ